MQRVLVAGAGLAGLRACEGLRRRGFAGEIVLLGDEPHLPYDRPPLSKQFLSGQWGRERLDLRGAASFEVLGIDYRAGPDHAARALNPTESRVLLAGGDQLSYDGLVIATGSRARRADAFGEHRGIRYLRTIDDAVALRGDLHEGVHLLVVGGGFVGMEVAATARALGAEVTVVELLAAPLMRLLGPLVGRACQRLHEAQGVSFVLGSAVTSMSEGSRRSLRAFLAGGVSVEVDVALVGVGAAPNVEWLADSGLRLARGGVECDDALRVAPGVVAAGDVASWPGGLHGEVIRLEHRTNAAEQGDHAAGTLLGEQLAFVTVPYVWSDQYDVKIQLLGLPEPSDDCRVVAGDPQAGRFVGLYGRGGSLSGVVGFSMPRLLMRLRPLLEHETPFESALSQAAALAEELA